MGIFDGFGRVEGAEPGLWRTDRMGVVDVTGHGKKEKGAAWKRLYYKAHQDISGSSQARTSAMKRRRAGRSVDVRKGARRTWRRGCGWSERSRGDVSG
jgi:hypothetical protein